MSYLTFHHGSYYFQLRVPKPLVEHHGPLIRTNLQTVDERFAKIVALKLAGDWLSRFEADLAGLASSEVEAIGSSLASQHVDISTTRNDNDVSIGSIPSPLPRRKPPASAANTVSDDSLLVGWKRIDPDRASTTVREMRAAIRFFRAQCKLPWSEVARADIASFRDQQLKKGLARKTVAKRVGMISTLLQTGFDAGVLPSNVARGLKIPKADIPTIVRRIFTANELTRLFDLPAYRTGVRPAGAGGEACIWIPMIALASGLRLEEIAQLRTIDILNDPEHGVLIRVTDEDPEQRVKTEGSKRIVPAHAQLIQSGFVDYISDVRAARQKWLFPALDPDHDGRRGANFGKWFMRQLRSRGGVNVQDPRLVFHSFRHTFKTLCRAAEITKDVHDALTGHVSGSVSRTYGEMPIAPLVRAVERIKLPVNLPRIVGGVRND
ncbi:hypothetical protein CEW83_02325 [Parazoarcus communis]|uniref:Tyr recombinase domain-containing protein n=1 Tax=Parazoarcus communis TaxID=41977 RepID=A0A2U8GKV4_9RHOO|nr:site-specific integrase [Parazoarcus communis]AWI74199.1 hypothetical protein CEW83_02325 [Parazoarcus communis]